MTDKEFENIFSPSYYGNVSYRETEFAFSEGYNFEILAENKEEGTAKGFLCNMEEGLEALNGREIEVKANIFQKVEI